MIPVRAVLLASALGAGGSAALTALRPLFSRLAKRRAMRARLKGLQTTYKLKNANGMEAHIIVVGCAVQRLLVPDEDGALTDVVLGCDDLVSYMDGTSPYFGAIVGRCANRISNATFSIKGEIYQLEANNGNVSLHGGSQGFDKAVWSCECGVEQTGDGEAVTLTLVSPAGDQGYPGEVHVSVTYTLTANNELRTDMRATTSEPTLVNLAQHSYFNLSGHKSGGILDHIVKINGDHYTPLNADMVPTGEICSVKGTALNFLTPQDIGTRIHELAQGGYDHNFVLHGMGPLARFVVKDGMYSKTPKMVASVYDPLSGRCMDVLSTAPAVQFYTGNFLDKTPGKEGARYEKHAGFCLETQGFPDAVNKKNFPSVILAPGSEYKHIMVHRFYSPSQRRLP